MAFEIKEKRGSLFKNDNKERENQPDFTGNVKINGKVWRIAGWNTESRGGTEYISLSVSDPEDFKRRDDPAPAPKPRLTDEEFEKKRQEFKANMDPSFDPDDIPF